VAERARQGEPGDAASAAWRAERGWIAVQANAMRMLRSLGLDAAVERAGARLRRWSFCNQAGEVLLDDLEALWQDSGPCIGIERLRLQQILVAGVEGIPCRLACRSDR
jgi:2-polyprenyl-6-methoxyphenol hydroxylase-like FAD-dependent oxidoreductase